MELVFRCTRDYGLPTRREKAIKACNKKQKAARQKRMQPTLYESDKKARAIEKFLFSRKFQGAAAWELAEMFSTSDSNILQFIVHNCFCVYEDRHRLYHTNFDISLQTAEHAPLIRRRK